MRIDTQAYLAGYRQKQALTIPGEKLVGGAFGGTAQATAKVGTWAADKALSVLALLLLVPPAMGGAAGMVVSKMTSPSKLDEESMQTLIEEQEVERMLAETGRLTAAQRGQLKRDKEKVKSERSLYIK